MIRFDKGHTVQKRLLPLIPKVFESQGRRLCHERSPRKNLREPLRIMVISTQTDSGRILLSHLVEGRPGLCQNLRQVLDVQQCHQTAVERINSNNGPVAICSVGVRHHGPILGSGTAAEIPYNRYRLLHKVSRS